MTTLGNYHHDFPRLVNQSGFYFQSHKGRVNWAEIENLNINDITEKRNFRLLEKNLINVINFDLEEDGLKISNQNFLKLFKLAQLGVDYLSYCEAYLDNCVVILQEQLIAFQEECKSLKIEAEKEKENGCRSKRKNKIASYQCEKCDKVFISDVYLKFHDKRRHSFQNPSKNVDKSPKRCDNYQRKSTSTQTAFMIDSATITHNDKDTIKVKNQTQIENLEEKIQDLKECLKKAESTLTEKEKTFKSNECHSSFPGQMCLNTVLLLLPSHQTQSGSGYHEVRSGNLLLDPELFQQNTSQAQKVMVDSKTADDELLLRKNPFQFSSEPENHYGKTENGLLKEKERLDAVVVNTECSEEHRKKAKECLECEKENINPEEHTKKAKEHLECDKENIDTEKCSKKTKEHLECDKENLDPNGVKSFSKLSTPLPPPRKSKQVISKQPKAEPKKCLAMEQFIETKRAAESQSEGISSQAVKVNCPLVTKKLAVERERLEGNLREVNEQESTSNKSLNSSKEASVEYFSGSFFKTILKKNSPKFRMMGKNLRKSLTNLYDSVSSTGKDLNEGSVDRNLRAHAVDGLNNRLRRLGVDPEWSGIPKKTVKYKLKALKHERKFLAKENPMYSIIRQNLEEKIFQKLKRNLEIKKTHLKKKFNEESTNTEYFFSQESALQQGKTEDTDLQSCIMYDIESELESKNSDSEKNFKGYKERGGLLTGESDWKLEVGKKEFDLSVFQAGKRNFNPENDVSEKELESLLDSDSDADFSDEKFTTSSSFLRDRRKNKDARDSSAGENQSVLKG